ncbi:MAG: efflux RND transporter permease subunit, partial [Thermoleophilia bacterium]|nr:efflux RND transporter permease subunit [Thermoleophilia bacterium]
TRRSLTSIRQLLVDTPDGGHVRLGEVAAVRIAPNPPVIRRQAVSRYLDVSAGIDGRDRDAVVRDVERRLGDLQFPLEYHTEIQAHAGQPYGTLVGVAIGAAIGILLLLQACFGSWRLAALGFLAFPLALTGGVVAAALTDGGAVSFGSAIGLFAIYGLAVRNGVRLVDRLRRLGRSGVEHGRGLVLQGAADGLAPTLLTAVAVALAMAPFAIRGDVPGYELAHPLALVVLGGLLTSTLVTLFVIPVLYLRFAAGTEPVAAPADALAEDLAPTRPEPVPTGMQRAVQTEPGT